MADPDASPGGRLSCVVDLHTVLVPSQRTLTWKLFISDALPDLLGAAGTSSDKITRIAADIERRAQDYASGGRAARRALRVPFTDDVATFQPVEAPVGVRADAAVVVRNSLLEDEHARGAVEDSDLTSIMTLATGALNEWLRMNSNTAEHTPPFGVFAGVATHARAYAALQALAVAAETGGRRSFRMPDAATPTRPTTAPPSTDAGQRRAVRSGLDDLDDELGAQLDAFADGSAAFGFVSSLSRYSRDSELLAQVLEFVLAHDATILTTNFLLRPREAFARTPPFISACSYDPLSALTTERMPGLMAKHTRVLIAQNQ